MISWANLTPSPASGQGARPRPMRASRAPDVVLTRGSRAAVTGVRSLTVGKLLFTMHIPHSWSLVADLRWWPCSSLPARTAPTGQRRCEGA